MENHWESDLNKRGMRGKSALLGYSYKSENLNKLRELRQSHGRWSSREDRCA